MLHTQVVLLADHRAIPLVPQAILLAFPGDVAAEVLRVAAMSTEHVVATGSTFGVAQNMHTHSGNFFSDDFTGDEYYGIVPLFDMNRLTGATALVPGSHTKVAEINAARDRKWHARHVSAV